MAQYINKAKVVSEIEKRIKETEEHWKSPYGIETATGRGWNTMNGTMEYNKI